MAQRDHYSSILEQLRRQQEQLEEVQRASNENIEQATSFVRGHKEKALREIEDME